MNLDIGAGARPHHGYKTIDVQEQYHPDYLGDFRTMVFDNIEIIRAHHILEHFGRRESVDVLTLWHDWLKPEGLLIVETPDFEGICESFGKLKSSKQRYWLARHAYGSQDGDWAFHRNAWYEDKFRELLPRLGFEIIEITHSVSRGYLPNIMVTAKKI